MSPKVQPSKILVYIASMFAITLWGMSYIWTDKLIALNIQIFYKDSYLLKYSLHNAQR